jgi:hypothetical protein
VIPLIGDSALVGGLVTLCAQDDAADPHPDRTPVCFS